MENPVDMNKTLKKKYKRDEDFWPGLYCGSNLPHSRVCTCIKRN